MPKYPQGRKEVVEGCIIERSDFKDFLRGLDKNTVDLVLTDPPYTISRKTGFSNFKNGVPRFAVSMDFGKWDHERIDLQAFAEEAYRVLRPGGTAIIWYDVWKVSHLHDALADAGFKMLRLIIWNKTNPVPLNSRSTYLSNSREMAVVGVKGGSPTFNSSYDNGNYKHVIEEYEDTIEDYEYPIPRHNGKRIHPTQKPLGLFRDLIRKHANSDDLIVDPFLGSGTTAIAALQENMTFAGCDIDEDYVKAAEQRVKTASQEKTAPRETKADRFLKLAPPNKDGVSRFVEIAELERHGLGFGNGADWCRDDSRLGRTYNVERRKGKGKIVGVKLNGLKSHTSIKSSPEEVSEGRCHEQQKLKGL